MAIWWHPDFFLVAIRGTAGKKNPMTQLIGQLDHVSHRGMMGRDATMQVLFTHQCESQKLFSGFVCRVSNLTGCHLGVWGL